MCLLKVLVGLASPQEEVGGLEDHVVYPLPRSAQDLVQRLEDFPTLSGFPFPGGHAQDIWGLSSWLLSPVEGMALEA